MLTVIWLSFYAWRVAEMLATRSNVLLKAAEARLLQAWHSLGIGVRIAKIVRYIAEIAPSRFIGICPFIGYT